MVHWSYHTQHELGVKLRTSAETASHARAPDRRHRGAR